MRTLLFMVTILVLCLPAHAAVRAFVTLPPQSFLLERIGGEEVKVNVLIQPNQDPHTFQLTPRQMTLLGQANLFFSLDTPFEKPLLKKITANLSKLTVVNTAANIKKRPLAEGHGDHHHHKGDHEERTAGLDPHIWLSAPLLIKQAREMTNALKKVDSKHAKLYEARFTQLKADLNHTHNTITKRLLPYKGKSILVFHPSFGYFTDAYGLKQKAVEVEGKSPTPKQLKGIINEAKEDEIRTVFVQSQFSKDSAKVIAQAIGGRVVPLDPLNKDVLANLQLIAEAIETSFVQ